MAEILLPNYSDDSRSKEYIIDELMPDTPSKEAQAKARSQEAQLIAQIAEILERG